MGGFGNDRYINNINRVSFICLYLFMCHEVSHHILEYPFKQ